MKQNQIEYGLPLKILSYNELYGWTMDKIVSQVGKKNNCTFCGVFRRQALDRGAAQLGVDHIVTGHNADDIAETVLMNSESKASMPSGCQSRSPRFDSRCEAPRSKLEDRQEADISNERRYSPLRTLYGRHDPGRRYDQKVETIQTRLRERNSHVCLFQEIDLFLYGMYLLS